MAESSDTRSPPITFVHAGLVSVLVRMDHREPPWVNIKAIMVDILQRHPDDSNVCKPVGNHTCG